MKDGLRVLSDEELIVRFADSGENRYLAEIVQRFRSRVYAGAFAVLRNVALAEEVMQESFLRVLMNAEKFRGGSFAAWLYRVTKNLSLHVLEKQREEPLDPDHEESAGVVLPVGGGLLIAREVRAILQQLERPQRVCLNLFYTEGLTYKEIAKATGYAEGSVRSHVQNGRKRFRKLWRQAETTKEGAK